MNLRLRLGLSSSFALAGLSVASLYGCSSNSGNPPILEAPDGSPDATTSSDSGSDGAAAKSDGGASDGGDGGLEASTSETDAASTDAASTDASSTDAASTDASSTDGGDAGALSAQAQAGLAASPFTVSTAGLTTAQAEQVGRGSYLVNVVSSCPDCHNSPAGGYLAGGTNFGPVYSRNLTSDATNGLRMTQAQFLETLQTGKDQQLSPTDGGPAVSLIVMPWEDFRWMSVSDLTAIYQYLLLVPANGNPDSLTIAGGPTIPVQTTFTDGAQTTAPTLPSEANDAPLFVARGLAVQPLVQPAGVSSLSAADQASYGRGAYLATAAAICGECHTNPERALVTSTKYNTADWLTGGRVFQAAPGAPPFLGVQQSMSADLLGATNGFVFASDVDETVFTTTIANHVHGDETGTPPLAWPMPVGLKNLVPADIHALWVYLSNQTPITGSADKATQGAALYCAPTDASASGVCPTGSTCNLTANECVPTGTCTADADCLACQTCTSGACALPEATADGGENACLANGI
jgi:mono/diheme cytochrome c family protein